MAIYFPSRYFLYLFLVIFIIFLTFKNEILLALRFADNEGSGVSLGEASSVRFDQYVLAPQFILEKPIFGHGFRGSETALFNVGGEKFEGIEIHNTFLLLLIDNGLIVGLTIIFFTLYLLLCSLRIIFDKSAPLILHIFSSIIIGGIASSLFEPHAIFTNFQQMPMWWISAGVIISYLQKNNNNNVRNIRNL
jgi:O-antigen ligase